MTAPFASAAELMARVLGMPGYRFAVIDHPLASMSEEQSVEMAESVLGEARRLLLDEATRASRS